MASSNNRKYKRNSASCQRYVQSNRLVRNKERRLATQARRREAHAKKQARWCNREGGVTTGRALNMTSTERRDTVRQYRTDMATAKRMGVVHVFP